MESWEHKIIRGKTDSLRGLPAGYLPDLASKWEIIEAGLPQQKKRVIPLLVRWSVAAAFIACVILMGTKLNQNNRIGQEMMAAIKIPSLPIPILIQKEKVNAVIEQAVITNDLQIIHKPAPVYKAEAIAKQNSKQLLNDELKLDPVISIIDSAIINTDELSITIPQPETPKRSKRRTFQKDFNDGLLVMDTGYSKPANPQFGFKLQLHKSTGDDAQPSRRLQLKQVL